MTPVIQKLYCIKDIKVGFWKPFVHPNDPVAIREFSNLVNYSDNGFVHQNYTDLELWCLGSFDETSGVIESAPEFLVRGIDVKKGE